MIRKQEVDQMERSWRETSIYYYNLFYTPELIAKAEEAVQELEPDRVRTLKSMSPLGILWMSHHDKYVGLVGERINEIKVQHGLGPLVKSPRPVPRFGYTPSPVFDVETGMDYPSRAVAGDSVGPSYGFKPGRWTWSRLNIKFPSRFVQIPYELYYEE